MLRMYVINDFCFKKTWRRYTEQKAAKRAHEIATGSPPTVTSDAIERALTEARPLTRYPVANANGLPVRTSFLS
jgi:hypothetical protein